VGFVLYALFPEIAEGRGSVIDGLEVISNDDFFDFVELTWIDTCSARSRVKRTLDASRLHVGYGAQPVIFEKKLDLGGNAAERRRALRELRPGLAQAAELGAEWFTVTSGPDPGDRGRPAAMAALAEGLEQMCREASGLGLRVLLELFDRGMDKRFLVGPSPEAATLASQVRRSQSNFGLILDHAHIPLTHSRLTDAVDPVSAYVDVVHLGNCVTRDAGHPLYGDKHPPYGYPGGENDTAQLAALLGLLRRNAFLGTGGRRAMSFEIKPPAGWPPRAVLAGAKRTLKAAWRAHIRADLDASARLDIRGGLDQWF